MDRLNYQHLFYFWNVAREGSVTRASEKLAPGPADDQRQLAIFRGGHRRAAPAQGGPQACPHRKGRTVYHYADEIFALGRELTNSLKGQAAPAGSGSASASPTRCRSCSSIASSRRRSRAAGAQVVCHEDQGRAPAGGAAAAWRRSRDLGRAGDLGAWRTRLQPSARPMRRRRVWRASLAAAYAENFHYPSTARRCCCRRRHRAAPLARSVVRDEEARPSGARQIEEALADRPSPRRAWGGSWPRSRDDDIVRNTAW